MGDQKMIKQILEAKQNGHEHHPLYKAVNEINITFEKWRNTAGFKSEKDEENLYSTMHTILGAAIPRNLLYTPPDVAYLDYEKDIGSSGPCFKFVGTKRRNTIGEKYLKEYLNVAPVSLALVRAIECMYLSELDFKRPMLDIGCGDALFASIFFKEQADQGMDISSTEVTSAKKTGTYKNVIVANALNIPFKDETLTTVFSNCVLEHIPQIDDVFKEVYRVLKKDGILIFTVPSDIVGEHLFFSSFFKKIGLSKIGEFYSQKFNSLCRHHNLYSPSIWEKKLEMADLELVSYQRYLSPNATKIHDIMLIFGVFSLIYKKLFRRMILFPALRKSIEVPILYLFLRRFMVSNSENGSSLLIVARKQGEK